MSQPKCQYDMGDRPECTHHIEYTVTFPNGLVKGVCYMHTDTYVSNMCKGDKLVIEVR